MVKRVVTGRNGPFGIEYKVYDTNGNQIGDGKTSLLSSEESREEGDHLITEQQTLSYSTRQSTRIRGSPKKREKRFTTWGLDG